MFIEQMCPLYSGTATSEENKFYLFSISDQTIQCRINRWCNDKIISLLPYSKPLQKIVCG